MGRTTIRDIEAKHDAGEQLTMLTAYDAPIARCVDAGGVDMILVGDTAGHNHHGYDDTLPVTMDEALSNTAAVARGTEEAMVIADLPFLSYGTSLETSLENAGKFMKEAGADAVKLETPPEGGTTVEIIDRLTELGIPVMGHLGLTPQRMNEIGGPVVQGRDGPESAVADQFVETAQELVSAGVFALVLEAVTEPVAKRITESITVPTIGIGAGRHVDGQVLVITDLLGLGNEGYRFEKTYADLETEITDAVGAFVDDVSQQAYPAREHVYEPIDE